MRVSVVIPIYNAGNFLRDAAISVLEQPEVVELILVDDGSKDDSLKICKQLEKEDPRVILLQHLGGINKGEAATRNLGAISATCEYLAFLDQDDKYLQGRFKTSAELFKEFPGIDGIYEAIGTNARDKISLQRHLQRVGTSMGKADPLLTTIDVKCKPEELFEILLFGQHGFFHIDGLTLRRAVIERIPLINPVMPIMGIGQDTDWFNRLAIQAKLMGGRLDEPVAIRNVYEGNSTLSIFVSEERRRKVDYMHCLLGRNLFGMMMQEQFSKRANRYILRRHLEYYNEYFIRQRSKLYRKLLKVWNVFRLFLRYPLILFKLI